MKKNNFEEVNIDHFTDLMKAINLHIQDAHQITFKNDTQTSQLYSNQWGKVFLNHVHTHHSQTGISGEKLKASG